MLELVLALTLAFAGDQRGTYLVVVPHGAPVPETEMDRRFNAIGETGAACVAGNLAQMMAQADLGRPMTQGDFAAARVDLADVAERSGWSVLRVYGTAMSQTEAPRAAWRIIAPLMDADGRVDPEPADAIVAPLHAVQSACQDYVRAQMQLAALIEREELRGVTDHSGLIHCAAFWTEDASRRDDPVAAASAALLLDLYGRHGATDGADRVRLNRDAFFSTFFDEWTLPDGTETAELARQRTWCTDMIGDLQKLGLLTD